jgi:hypothetical protein
MKVLKENTHVTIVNNSKYHFLLLFFNEIVEQEGETDPAWGCGSHQ